MFPLAPIDDHADNFQEALARARNAFSSFRRQCMQLVLWDCRIAQLVGWDDHAEMVCSYHAAGHVWRPYAISLDMFRSLPIASDTQLLACSSGAASPSAQLDNPPRHQAQPDTGHIRTIFHNLDRRSRGFLNKHQITCALRHLGVRQGLLEAIAAELQPAETFSLAEFTVLAQSVR